MLMYRNGAFFVNDCVSKFGTLMMVRNHFQTSSQSPTHMYQIGKCVIEFHVKKVEKKCLSICGG